MSQKEQIKGEVVIYKGDDGPEVRVDFHDGNVWLTQAQIAELFQTDRSSVTKHSKNIINSSELSEKSNVQFLHIANSDKPVKFYSLDFIISIGYRVNSKRATQFRIWATQRLRDYVLKGFVVNEKRLKEDTQNSMKELEGAVKLLQGAMQSERLAGYEKELLKIITDYTETWVLLNKYDHDGLLIENTTKKITYRLEYEQITKAIAQFKKRLVSRGEASELFGVESGEKLQGLLGNIEQTFAGKDLYPSLEEKAAHLLYFAIKDHPFVDGNKRSGSLLFLLFLIRNHALYNKHGERKLNDNALAALALLIAESKPEQKEIMIKLVVNLINRK